jgi:hypothetical protein
VREIPNLKNEQRFSAVYRAEAAADSGDRHASVRYGACGARPRSLSGCPVR